MDTLVKKRGDKLEADRVKVGRALRCASRSCWRKASTWWTHARVTEHSMLPPLIHALPPPTFVLQRSRSDSSRFALAPSPLTMAALAVVSCPFNCSHLMASSATLVTFAFCTAHSQMHSYSTSSIPLCWTSQRLLHLELLEHAIHLDL